MQINNAIDSFQLWMVLKEAEHSPRARDTDTTAFKASWEIKRNKVIRHLFLILGNKISSLILGTSNCLWHLVKYLGAADSRDLANPGDKMRSFDDWCCTATLASAGVDSPASVSPICNRNGTLLISAMGLAKIASNMKMKTNCLL